MENRALIGSGAEMVELLEFMRDKHNHKKYNIRVLYNKSCCSNGATGDPSHENHILINLLSNKRVGEGRMWIPLETGRHLRGKKTY